MQATATDLVQRLEGKRLVAYKDQRGVWTVGYGFTTFCGEPVVEGMSITDQDCEIELTRRLSKVGDELTALLGKSYPGCFATTGFRFAALVSFCYNIGIFAFSNGGPGSSPSHVFAACLKGDWQGAADAFLAWNHADGVVLEVLTLRRKFERLVFMGSDPDVAWEQVYGVELKVP